MKCCEVKIGELRRLITFEKSTRVADTTGGSTVTWSDRVSVYAKLVPKTANQVLFSQQLKHRVTHEITIRYRSDILISDRISYDSRTFHVRGYRDPEERKRWLIIDAEEGEVS